LGKSIGDAVGQYNQFIGSLDSRVLPAARRLAQLAAPEAEIIELAEVDLRPRTVAVPQPSESADDAAQDTG